MTHRKILSKTGKEAIRVALEGKQYENRTGHLEPPYMAPSTEEGDYSSVSTSPTLPMIHCLYLQKWCSLCKDLGAILVLCNGCRVSICLKTHETVYGCLQWKPEIDDDRFTFYCIFCVMADRYECSVCFPKHSSIC